MAAILSFETHCHLEAIERDLLVILSKATLSDRMAQSAHVEFTNALNELEGEVFVHRLADSLAAIIKQEQLNRMVIGMVEVIKKEQLRLEMPKPEMFKGICVSCGIETNGQTHDLYFGDIPTCEECYRDGRLLNWIKENKPKEG